MHAIAQTMLLADISSSCNLLRRFGMLLVKTFCTSDDICNHNT
jgi:hypothetical protein